MRDSDRPKKQLTKHQEQVAEDFSTRLLERPPQKEYRVMWSDLLKKDKSLVTSEAEASLVLFGLGHEWVGINTMCLYEITECRKIHTVPNTRSQILRGVVNLKGQIRLCINLHKLLGIDVASAESEETLAGQSSHLQYPRMLAINRFNEIWVFAVESVWGVINYNQNDLIPVPVNVTKSSANYFKGILSWEKKNVSVLDEELVFESLRRLVP